MEGRGDWNQKTTTTSTTTPVAANTNLAADPKLSGRPLETQRTGIPNQFEFAGFGAGDTREGEYANRVAAQAVPTNAAAPSTNLATSTNLAAPSTVAGPNTLGATNAAVLNPNVPRTNLNVNDPEFVRQEVLAQGSDHPPVPGHGVGLSTDPTSTFPGRDTGLNKATAVSVGAPYSNTATTNTIPYSTTAPYSSTHTPYSTTTTAPYSTTAMPSSTTVVNQQTQPPTSGINAFGSNTASELKQPTLATNTTTTTATQPSTTGMGTTKTTYLP